MGLTRRGRFSCYSNLPLRTAGRSGRVLPASVMVPPTFPANTTRRSPRSMVMRPGVWVARAIAGPSVRMTWRKMSSVRGVAGLTSIRQRFATSESADFFSSNVRPP